MHVSPCSQEKLGIDFSKCLDLFICVHFLLGGETDLNQNKRGLCALFLTRKVIKHRSNPESRGPLPRRGEGREDSPFSYTAGCGCLL